MPTAPNYCNVAKSGQSWDWDEGLEINGHHVRVQIHHDVSYPHQSSAKASVWLPAHGWVPVATYLPAMWADDRRPGAAGEAPEGTYNAYSELLARAETILG